ncbi:sulfonate ABC transporter permease [Alcanivorax hongdengensis A-11-3]|uniref:Sulfonate ABC transporter permease n=1 Tax=Alcanivorax hongdengensis A-11-3 TaxID=1177179 RepID=L0WG63_9GAMM|nr:ABC transporter permease subunit [Alcanivorax hongdengensis]EKF75704.1 sulfonate ABC transporter permease [Alcanivorax hongdengensis A-11-3]
MKKLINRQPGRVGQWALGLLPFVLLIIAYLIASDARLAANANDKLLPALNSFADAIQRMAFEPSKRSGDYLLWVDTLASLQRLAMGVGISALMALAVGIANGTIPYIRATLSPLVTGLSLVPPMAMLPVLFIIFGLGELAKVMLIIIGITPFLIRDLQQRALEIPREQIIKMQTLGANSWQIITRLVWPQLMPRLIGAVRLSLGPAWLFLIAAEAIAATEGLGYRIFLVRRYLAMDVILPYVVWITLLAFAIDFMLSRYSRWRYPWFHQQGH